VAYVIHRKYAELLLKDVKPIELVSDHILSKPSPRKHNIYTVHHTYDPVKVCWCGPLLRKGKWICGGELNSGATTTRNDADFGDSAPTVAEIVKRAHKKTRKRSQKKRSHQQSSKRY
jgi:hypothetical protein